MTLSDFFLWLLLFVISTTLYFLGRIGGRRAGYREGHLEGAAHGWEDASNAARNFILATPTEELVRTQLRMRVKMQASGERSFRPAARLARSLKGA